MSDATAALVSERVDKLLADVDPTAVDQTEFRGRQYDLGLAWVHGTTVQRHETVSENDSGCQRTAVRTLRGGAGEWRRRS